MSSEISLDRLSPEELDMLEKDIQKQRRGRERAERKTALAAAEAAAKEHGFSLRELVGEAKKKTRAPAAPKYRNPEDAEQTWSGRGRRPLWVRAAVKAGRPLEDFAIK